MTARREGGPPGGRARATTWPVRPLDELGDRIWVVFGGGGVRGVAHAGAWQALAEAEVPVAGIVGTSIGALIGACIAGGMPWDELVRLGLSLEKSDIARLNRGVVWVNGIREESVFRGDVLREYIERVLPVSSWSELEMPLQVNAVDLGSGRTVWFGSGAREDVAIADACYASTALGVLYPPARIDGRLYVDGGTDDVLACDRARDLGATGIIAIDVGSGEVANADRILEQGLVAVHDRVFAIMSGRQRREMVGNWTGPPLWYVRPAVDEYSAFAIEHTKYFLEEGYRSARRVLSAPERRA